MKKLVFLLSFFAALGAGAQQKQSLKDLLYSGKLRSDSNTVVRKSDDLATKIDTSTRKPAEPVVVNTPVVATETALTTKATTTTTPPVSGTMTSDNTSTATEPAAEAKPAAPAKSNTRLLKEYTDSLLANLQSGVLTNKKIKKDSYFIIAEYEIGPDGTTTVGNVTSSPENALLQSEIKSQMELGFPKLAPVMDSSGTGRKVKRKHSFTVTKE